jgi:hypothetical protein
MSRIEIYGIATDGTTRDYDEVRNAQACAPHIWAALAHKLGSARPYGDADLVWRAVGSPALTDDEAVANLFTWDGTWVRRENLPRLADALDAFWRDHHTTVGSPDLGEVCPTIPGVVAVLRRAATDASLRGVCFNQTSVNSSPWSVRVPLDETLPTDPARDPEAYEEESGWRPFVFGRDERNGFGAAPYELFERLAELRGEGG